MKNKITRKNNILSAVLGAACGCILSGISILNWSGVYQQTCYKVIATIMIVVGACWIMLFVFVNRKILFRSIKNCLQNYQNML